MKGSWRIPWPKASRSSVCSPSAPSTLPRRQRRALLPLLLIGCIVALLPRAAQAEVARRYGLFVGQNDGGRGTRPLLFAESDAARVRDLFVRIGSVAPRDSILLIDADRSRLLEALRTLRASIERDRAAGQRSVLLFYYSGHADTRDLHLGSGRLALTELKQAVTDSGADLRLLLLDACHSGEATRLKGGTRAPAFLVQADEGDSLTGEVILSSSAADETSQESDRVGGGYFTHHLISGLLGAADSSSEGEVTLEEAYRYAYHHTLFETAGSAAGLQHPSVQSNVRGHGLLVLTRPDPSQTVLVFPSGLEGHYLVFDRNRKRFVAELRLNGLEPRRLSLPAGRYLVQKRTDDHLLTADLVMTRGATRQLDERTMIRTGFETDFARGVTAANLRRATRSPVRLSPWAGFQSFLFQPPGTPLFPTMPVVGLEIAWRDLIGPRWSLTVDVATGGLDTSLDFAAYDLETLYRQTSAGVGLRYGIEAGRLEFSVGPHLALYYIRRSFPGSAEPEQDFGHLLPGAAGQIGIEVIPRVTFGVLGRIHSLYYDVDGTDSSFVNVELALQASMQF